MREKRKTILIWLLFFGIVFGVIVGCRTIDSGYHFVDDHEIIRIRNELQKENVSIIECMKKYIETDMQIRFRPIYSVMRVFFTWLFGTNWILWSIEKGIETVIALAMLCLCAKKKKINLYVSICFALMVMMGPQATVWFRLGPQENTAIMFFSIGFYFLLCYFEKRRVGLMYICFSFLLFSSLIKESFVMCIPPTIIYIIGEECEGEYSIASIWSSIRKNIGFLFALGVTWAIEVWIIVFKVGTNQIGYAGLNMKLPLIVYIRNIRDSIRGDCQLFILLFIGIIFLFFCCTRKNKNSKTMVIKSLPNFFLGFLIVIVQISLYAQSGMHERYLIPWTFGMAFILICFPYKIFLVSKQRYYFAYILLLTGFILLQGITTVNEAIAFTQRGRNANAILNAVLSECQIDENIVTAFMPETDWAVTVWLADNGQNNVYTYENGEEEFVREYPNKEEKEKIQMKDVDYLLCYNEEDNNYVGKIEIDLSNFSRHDYGTYSLYILEKSQ